MSLAAQRQIHRAAIALFAERGAMQVSVTDLAQAAGVARGTIYNNLGDLSGLFDLVAVQLAAEMSEEIARAVAELDDPVRRLGMGLRLFVRRAGEDREWGRFIGRFGFSAAALREFWKGQPLADLREGRANGRFLFDESQLDAMVHVLSGAAMGAVAAVVEGAADADSAGSDVAEWALAALGLPRAEARAHAQFAPPGGQAGRRES